MAKRKWKRMKALPGALINGCLCCPPIQAKFNLRNRIAIGFGYAAVECDGKLVWQEGSAEFDKCWTGMRAENAARRRRRGDWRIIIEGPLSGRTYQRHGKNTWVLIENNQGFA